MEFIMKEPLHTRIQMRIRDYWTAKPKPDLVWLNIVYYLGFGWSVYFDGASGAGVVSVLPIGFVTVKWLGLLLLLGGLIFLVGRNRRWYSVAAVTYVPYLLVSVVYWAQTGSRQATFVHTFAFIAAWLFSQIERYQGERYAE
jgi:hypothetical protein